MSTGVTADRSELSTTRKLLFAAVATALVLGACEAGLRVRAWMRYGSASAGVRDPMLTFDRDAGVYVPRPGYEVQGAKIHIKINSLGFRGDEFTREKPARTVRIACLGASTTFCAETSSNHTTWPHRLQEKLQAAHPDVKIEVINAAVGGYVASDNVKVLRHRVLPLNPDLVIYYEANNEIVKDTHDFAAREGIAVNSGPSPLAKGLSKYSLMFDLAYKNLTIMAGERGGTTARKIERVPADLPDHFIGELDEMRKELASRGVPLMLSTFLVKYRRGQERQTQVANADVAFYYMPWMSIEGMLDAMDVYNGAILRYAKEHDLPAVDDRDAILPDAAHYSDCMHLKDAGAEAMADRFLRFLEGRRAVEGIVAARQGGSESNAASVSLDGHR
jgi:lysophospholipase L1-like esterase